MFFYLTIGLIILLSYVLLYKGNNKNIYLCIISIFLILISALRSNTIGNDTSTYVKFFELINGNNYLEYIKNETFEICFVVLNYIIKLISQKYILFLTITSLIIYLPIFNFIKKESLNFCVSFALFFFLLYFFESMNIIRQYIAVSIIVYSYKYIKKQKIFKFIITILLATLFHKSAIVGILLYLLYNIKSSKKRIIISIIIGILIFLFSNIFFATIFNLFAKYISYANRINEIHTASIFSALLNLFIFLFIYFINKNKVAKENHFYINVCLMSFLINLLSIKINILGRIALYFEIFNLSAIPNSIIQIKQPKDRILAYLTIIIIAIAYFIIVMTLRPDWYNVIPYQTSI